jgi:hypothetical protein
MWQNPKPPDWSAAGFDAVVGLKPSPLGGGCWRVSAHRHDARWVIVCQHHLNMALKYGVMNQIHRKMNSRRSVERLLGCIASVNGIEAGENLHIRL